MGLFGFLKSKESLDRQAEYLDKKIDIQRHKAAASDLRKQAMMRVMNKQRELQKLKMQSRAPEVNMMTNRLKHGAGIFGTGLLKTSKALGTGLAQASKNYAANAGKRDQLLNQVMGIKPLQPKQEAPKTPKKMVFVLRQ